MDILLDYHFWLNIAPGSLPQPVFRFLLILALFFLFVYLFFNIYKNRVAKTAYQKIWLRLKSFFLVNSIILLVLLFFSYEVIPYLSVRILYLILLLTSVVWLFFILKQAMIIPKIKEEIKKEQEFRKYIP